jgi:Ca2+-binding RTX toxin-like protein
MESLINVSKISYKDSLSWKKFIFQDVTTNFSNGELSDDLKLILLSNTDNSASAIFNTYSLGYKSPISFKYTIENSLIEAEIKSVQPTVSKTQNAVITAQKLHVSGCACSFCKLPTVDKKQAQKQQQTIAASGTLSTTGSGNLDLSQTFFLNSLAGANHTIYLDFNGHTTSGTSWNTYFTNGANIVTSAFDFDGNTASFSTAELERIQYIWQRVAEDFRPFNVNVTTQAPTDINDLIKSGSNDTRWGVRVVIGGSGSNWFGSVAGGVAYLDSFNSSSDTPAFVFSDDLSYSEKYTAEAISHEVGHTLGLYHDGQISPSEEYYKGQGSGQTGWASIMGVGYYQNLTQWSKGQYGSADNTEDDLQIITTQNGFGYRADDAGNTIATAKALTNSGTTLNGSGIIERNTDIDYYSFFTSASSITITVNPFTRGPNLDIWAGVYNSGGTLIASSNPADLLSASITTSVAPGTYYLAIDGVGNGDPLSTGYTDYGSLGQYFIEIISDDFLNGGDGNDNLDGGDGNDTLDGGAGNDTLIGGLGDDTYIVDSTTDTIIENVGEGTDIIFSSVTFSLAALANIEKLTLTGTDAINGTGNAANNVITGNTANNSINGGAGNDTLIGGLGDDTYIVDSTTDTIIENIGEGTDTIFSSVTFSLAALVNIENLTLAGTGGIKGTGNAANNVITGNTGNNSLNGGGGNDTLIGSLGNDTYVVDSTTDTIIENAGEGTDTISSTVTFSLATLANIENLTLTGTAAINGTGNTANNVITGNSGNNTLNGGSGNDKLTGGAGNDTLIGGLGNDTYTVDSNTDTIIENAGEGTDTVSSSVTFSLSALVNIENLTLTGTAAINGTGNTANNVITGNSGNNSLNGGSGNDKLTGGAGNDTLIGGLGNDTYTVDSTTDTIVENTGEGTDTVSSSVTFSLAALVNVENLTLTGTAAINGTGNTANNVITGNTGNNSLDGGAGNDILTGKTGKDTLTGGLGVDRFDYRNLGDSLLSNFDVITDFNANAGNDLLLISTTRAGFFNAGTVATLDTNGIISKLNTDNFAAHFAAQFTFGSRTFVAINNGTTGFNETTDAVIEVTGLTGTLGINNFTKSLV